MNEIATRSPEIIISQVNDRPQYDQFQWLNYFDPQAALVDFVNYIETLPGSRTERHTMRAYFSSLAEFCRFLGAHVIYTSAEDYTFNFDNMRMPGKNAVMEYMAFCVKQGRSSSTIVRYMAAIRHWLRALEEQPLQNIQSSADMFFMMECQRQLRLAISSKNPAADVTSNRPALEQHGTRLNLIDVNRVFAYFEDKIETLSGKRDVALLYLGITTGLRAAEMARLTLNNIRPGNGCYEIRVRGKRNNFDPVGMDTEAYNLIQQWVTAFNAALPTEDDERRITGDTPIFQPLLKSETPVPIGHANYDPDFGISPRAILKIVERRTQAALDYNIGAHDLRRTCAYLMRNHGFELEQIRDMLRHRSLVTTEKYIGKEQNLQAMLLSGRIKIFVPHDSRGAA